MKYTQHYHLKIAPKDYQIHAYADADHSGDPDDAKSTLGILVLFGGAPISWISRKQALVSNSTAYAEYQAIAAAVNEVEYIVKVIRALGFDPPTPIVYSDNAAARSIAQSNKETGMNKHINIKFHISREAVEQKRIILSPISSIQNYADGLTKAIDLGRLQFLQNKILYPYQSGWNK